MSGAGNPNWGRFKRLGTRMKVMRQARNAEIDREIYAAEKRRKRLVEMVRAAHRRMMEAG